MALPIASPCTWSDVRHRVVDVNLPTAWESERNVAALVLMGDEETISGVDRALERCDALLLPSLPIPAPPVGATTVDVGDADMPVRAAMLSRTQLFNITGHPAIALPAGRGTDGLPRSLQLVGPNGRTARLLDIAAALEDVIH